MKKALVVNYHNKANMCPHCCSVGLTPYIHFLRPNVRESFTADCTQQHSPFLMSSTFMALTSHQHMHGTDSSHVHCCAISLVPVNLPSRYPFATNEHRCGRKCLFTLRIQPGTRSVFTQQRFSCLLLPKEYRMLTSPL